MMEWRGKPPESLPKPSLPRSSSMPSGPAPTRLTMLEARWDELEGEIEERHAFLAQMRQLGKAGQYEQQLMGEIAEKFRALRVLDGKIKGEVEAALGRQE